jgi:hypothetical protein
MSYYRTLLSGDPFSRAAERIKDKFIVDFREPSFGDYFLDCDGFLSNVITRNGPGCSERPQVGKKRFILSPAAPTTHPSGAFGAVYPKGVKCDGTWIPVDFRPVAKGDWGITRERKVSQWENSWPNVNRIIVQKIESPAATKGKVKMEKTNKLEKSDLRNFRFEIGADEIYQPEVIVPKGYEVYDFCPPSTREYFIGTSGGLVHSAYDYQADSPRLLVRPVAKIDWNKELENANSGSIPRGWRPVGFRLPRTGDYYCFEGQAEKSFINFRQDSHLILERAPLEFTFDGVTFEAPIGYEFVRVGYITPEEIKKGCGVGLLAKQSSSVQLWQTEPSESTYPNAIFRPVSN